MANTQTGDFYQVIMRTNKLAHGMRTVSERIHSASGVTTGMRGILEYLALNEPQTVPRIAADKGVSRQNIQVIINDLLASGLVAAQPNPGHKRSPLIRRTASGESLFRAMRERESKVIEHMTRDLSDAILPEELRAAARALRLIQQYFGSPEWQQQEKSLAQSAQTN